jgi:hypothetical protein
MLLHPRADFRHANANANSSQLRSNMHGEVHTCMVAISKDEE